jgi:hypothetical protein
VQETVSLNSLDLILMIRRRLDPVWLDPEFSDPDQDTDLLLTEETLPVPLSTVKKLDLVNF